MDSDNVTFTECHIRNSAPLCYDHFMPQESGINKRIDGIQLRRIECWDHSVAIPPIHWRFTVVSISAANGATTKSVVLGRGKSGSPLYCGISSPNEKYLFVKTYV